MLLHLLCLLNPWLIVKMRPVSVFFVGVTLEGVKLDALNWFFNSLFYSWFFYNIICIWCSNVCVNGFFHSATRHWNVLCRECFPLTYDLNDFKSRFVRIPLALSSSNSFTTSSLSFSSVLSLYYAVLVQPCIM